MSHEQYYVDLAAFEHQGDLAKIEDATTLGEVYVGTLNLRKELEGLLPGAVIYDLGCANLGGTVGLAKQFPGYTIVGIAPFEPLRRSDEVEFVPAKAEELNDPNIIALLEQAGFPPSVIIAREMMGFPIQAIYDQGPEMLQQILIAVAAILPHGGLFLIYESEIADRRRENQYKTIQEAVAELQLPFRSTTEFTAYAAEGDVIKFNPMTGGFLNMFYLRLEKA